MKKNFITLNLSFLVFFAQTSLPRYNEFFEPSYQHHNSFHEKPQDCSSAGGAWAIIGTIVGVALSITLLKRFTTHQQAKEAKKIARFLCKKSQEARTLVTHLKILYHYELNKTQEELTEYYYKHNKMHHKPSKETIEKLKQDIAELEEALIYLYGQEHEETKELLAQLHTLYTLYMTLFVEPTPTTFKQKGFSYESK